MARLHALTAASILLLGAVARSAPARSDSDVQLHGFANLVGSQTDTELPLNGLNNEGRKLNLDAESRLGLNLSVNLSDQIAFAAQAIAQGDDGGQYGLNVDWLFVTFRPWEGVAVRAGRQINPIFLFSEQIDVGFVYPWTRLPYEMYSLSPLDSFNGLSVIYTHMAGDIMLRAQIYGGAGADQKLVDNGTTVQGTNHNDKGFELSAATDWFRVRAGYTASNPELTATDAQGHVVPYDLGTAQTFSLGGSGDLGHAFAIAELTHVWTGGGMLRRATGAYATVGYHLLPAVTVLGTYSWLGGLDGQAFTYPDPTQSRTAKTDQHSFVFGVNYKFTTSVLLKAEYMRTQENFADPGLNFGANTFSLSLNLVF